MLSSSTTPPPGFVSAGMQINAYPTNGRVPQMAAMPIPRAWAGAATVGAHIYVVGGTLRDGQNDPDNTACQRFTPSTNSWLQLPRMSIGRYSLSVVAVGTNVFAIGGYNGTNLRVVEYLDTTIPRWNRLPDMPVPRTGGAAAALDGRIYVLAGIDSALTADTPLRREELQKLAGTTSFVFVPPNFWASLAPAPTGLYSPGCAVIGRNIYLIGSFSGPEGRNYAYNVDDNKWTEIASLDPGWWWPTVVAIGGYLYVFGGCQISYGISRSQGLVARYDPATNQWDKLPMEIAPRRSALASAGGPNTAYIFGGMDCTWKNTAVGTVEALTPSDLVLTLFRKT